MKDASNKLLAKLIQNSATKANQAQVLSESNFFNKRDLVTTAIPAVNIALSGSLDGGLSPGLTVLAGPSRHYKTGIGLIMVSAYLKKYPEAVCIYYDSEFGTTEQYFRAAAIDTSRVIHNPIEHIEQLKFDLSKKLETLVRGDRVIIFVDSVGNLASKKEIDDALDEKAVADMTRAKALRSMFRIMTPHLTTKDIPAVVIAHTYDDIGGNSHSQVVGGGHSITYSANTILIIGRQQEKKEDELTGYKFILKNEKSRFVKEKSAIPLMIDFEKGISRWSGLLDLAIEAGLVTKPSDGWFQYKTDKKRRRSETDTLEFWGPILKETNFMEWVKEKYSLPDHDQLPELDDEFNKFMENK